MRYSITSIFSFMIISAIMAFCCQQQNVISARISEIKNNPLKYDGKVVRISGFMMSGHGGVILLSEDRKDGIRLRSPDVVHCPVPVQRDALFETFWTTYTEIHSDEPNWTDIKAEIEGFVRVLKENGKIAKEFDFYGQYPLEVITTRIISFEHEPLPETERPLLWPRSFSLLAQ
jgi:hypothetical protein